jgi:hypothetical protein
MLTKNSRPPVVYVNGVRPLTDIPDGMAALRGSGRISLALYNLY